MMRSLCHQFNATSGLAAELLAALRENPRTTGLSVRPTRFESGSARMARRPRSDLTWLTDVREMSRHDTWESFRALATATSPPNRARPQVTATGRSDHTEVELDEIAVLHAVTSDRAITPALGSHRFARDPHQVSRIAESRNLVLVFARCRRTKKWRWSQDWSQNRSQTIVRARKQKRQRG